MSATVSGGLVAAALPGSIILGQINHRPEVGGHQWMS
jgi:hypothetical protein